MKNSNIYTVIFVAVLCTVCAGLMALVNNELGADIQANREYARIRAAVQALDLLAGTTHATSEAERAATKEAYKNFLTPGKFGSLDVLRCSKPGMDKAFVVEVNAILRNGPMRAYMAFENEDGKKALGFRVFAHQETGGLGAKIATDEEWIQQFSGLQLHEGGSPGISIVKAGSEKSAPNVIDAITNASQTMLSLGKALNLTIASVSARGVDASNFVELVFYEGTPCAVQGIIKATVAYPDNITPEQKSHLRKADYRRPAFMVRKGIRNVAMGKPVVANKEAFGDLKTVTDGSIDCSTTDMVLKLTGDPAEGADEDEAPAVTVDLGKEYDVEAICVWHNYKRPIVFENIVVQVSAEKNFPEGKTTTIFNNDYEDMLGFGEGEDMLFPASVWGELIRVGAMGKGQKVRYVRVYTEGVLNDLSSMPAFLEVGVYARPK